MIVDTLDNLPRYLPAEVASDISALLADPQILDREAGCYTLDSGLQYHFKRHNTSPADEHEFETHERFADLQIVLSGEETIGYTPRRDDLKVTVAYDKKDDITFYENDGNMMNIKLSPGMFTLLCPQDAHMPGLQTNDSVAVRKIVVKIPVDIL